MDGLVKIIVAIIFLAGLAVIFSKRSKSVDAINNIGSMFTGAIRQIVTPIS